MSLDAVCLAAMRIVLVWLMMLGVFAGLTARAVPTLFVHGHSHDHGHGHEAESWHTVSADEDHHDSHDDPVGESDDRDSPISQDHHHHQVWEIPVAMAAEPSDAWEASSKDCLLLGRQTLSLFPPEGPYLDLDAPPLI